MSDQEEHILQDAPADVEALFGDEPVPAEEVKQPVEETAEEPAAEVPEQPQEIEVPAEETEPQEPVEEEPDPFSQYRDDKGLILGKYKTGEDWVNAHKHQDAYATRLAQERADLERRAQEYETAIANARPVLEQWAKERQAQQQPQFDPDMFDPNDPQQLQEFIDQRATAIAQEMAQQQVGTFQQQQVQMQAAQEHAAKQQEFYSWQQENPDVVPGSDQWTAMNNVIYELQYDPQAKSPVEDNFPVNRENLSIAKTLATEPQTFEMVQKLQFIPSDEADVQLLRDAATNPALASHLRANPTYLETIEGHTIARQLAGMPEVVNQAQQNATQASQQQAARQRQNAYVESDTPGAPAAAAPGDRADDVWEDIGGQLWEKERSIFNR